MSEVQTEQLRKDDRRSQSQGFNLANGSIETGEHGVTKKKPDEM